MSTEPSLKGHLAEIISYAYKHARIEASNETGLDLDIFPEEMPFNFEDTLTEGWFPN